MIMANTVSMSAPAMSFIVPPNALLRCTSVTMIPSSFGSNSKPIVMNNNESINSVFAICHVGKSWYAWLKYTSLFTARVTASKVLNANIESQINDEI